MAMDSFLIVGNGGREAVFARRLSEDSVVHACMAKHNDTIAGCVKETGGAHATVDTNDPQSVLRFATRVRPDYVFVSADDPLANGVVDTLLEHGFDAIGPSRAGAKIEWDKAYALDIMDSLFPSVTPRYSTIRTIKEAKDAIRSFNGAELVVKPQGLTGGKGVKVMGYHLADYQDCLRYTQGLLEARPGEAVILVEKLRGREFTIMGITDGESLSISPASYDYPFRMEGDTGPGTGGMGSVTQADGLLPFLTCHDIDRCRLVMQGVIEELAGRRLRFNGVLNAGFFRTDDGIKFMEFNSRFGDPEALNILSVMKDSFSSVLRDIHHKTLSGVQFTPQSSVVKYAVAREYPDPSPAAIEFTVDEAGLRDRGISTYTASCARIGGNQYRTLRTSRVMGFAKTGGLVRDTALAVNEGLDACLKGDLQYRRDIGLDIF